MGMEPRWWLRGEWDKQGGALADSIHVQAPLLSVV